MIRILVRVYTSSESLSLYSQSEKRLRERSIRSFVTDTRSRSIPNPHTKSCKEAMVGERGKKVGVWRSRRVFLRRRLASRQPREIATTIKSPHRALSSRLRGVRYFFFSISLPPSTPLTVLRIEISSNQRYRAWTTPSVSK